MPPKFGTCPACQKNEHDKCSNNEVCVCALRGHPVHG